MAATRRSDPNDVSELLKTLIITQLAIAGVPGPGIRAVVGCGMNRVTAVLKQVAKRSAKKKARAA
jgi:hypothetical protein